MKVIEAGGSEYFAAARQHRKRKSYTQGDPADMFHGTLLEIIRQEYT